MKYEYTKIEEPTIKRVKTKLEGYIADNYEITQDYIHCLTFLWSLKKKDYPNLEEILLDEEISLEFHIFLNKMVDDFLDSATSGDLPQDYFETAIKKYQFKNDFNDMLEEK